MKPAPHDEFAVGVPPHLLLRLLGYFRPYLPALFLGLVLAFAFNATVLARPWIIKHVIDEYAGKALADTQPLLWFGLLYLGIVLVAGVLSWVQTVLLTRVGQDILKSLRNQVFRHLERQSLSFFDRNASGRLLTRVTTDVEALGELFSGVFVSLIRDGLMVVGIIVVMFSLDVSLAWVGVGCVPVLVVATWIYRRAARQNFSKIKGMISRINGFLAENITGMNLVQIFHREKEKEGELKDLDREYIRYSLREVVLNSFSRPLVDLIANLTIAVLLVVCMGGLGDKALAVGVLYAFISYVRQFFEPIGAIAEQYTTIQSGMVSAARIFEVLDAKTETEDLERGTTVPPLRGSIEFKNVWFAYRDEHWVLRDVSFRIEAGEHWAIVGHTGSGKSTIIGLLMGFYRPQRGEILIDGVELGQWRLDELRRRIGIVQQDVFLFSGTLMDNLRLGSPHATEEDVYRALTLVQADRVVAPLSQGLYTVLSERGGSLSAGERQLLSFARAMVSDPCILVLDEATATIDTTTEQAIQESLAQLGRGRTSLVIAHRLSTIVNSDQILVLGQGEVLEVGSHEELLKRGGAYAQLQGGCSLNCIEK